MHEYCTKTKKKFKEMAYIAVGWSGDKLLVCPHCHMSPYEGEKYLLTHKDVKTFKLEQEQIKK